MPTVPGMPALTEHLLTAYWSNSDSYVAPFLETIKYHSGTFLFYLFRYIFKMRVFR